MEKHKNRSPDSRSMTTKQMFEHWTTWIIEWQVLMLFLPVLPVRGFSTSVTLVQVFYLRYVGVIRFAFHVLQLLSITFPQQRSWLLANLWRNICKDRVENQNSLYFSNGYQKRMFVDFVEWKHRSSQLCLLLSVEWLLILEDIVQSFLNMCLYDVCSLILTDHILLKSKGFN